MQIKLFSGPGRCFALTVVSPSPLFRPHRCFALTPSPLPAGEGLLSFPLPWRERVALSLSKGRVRGRTDRPGAGDTMRITRPKRENLW